ncbi:alpha/beta fold hydrolase [Microbispora sp. CA-135349]|uniref:alpha/beta fold hydrolase n=1 Tax=Microbispora sp. CA-135349 TaxID=3239953 RepID=UPI003D8B7508
MPGGPGSSGIEDIKRAAGDLTGLRERFDLVAYDPRNIGLAAEPPESCAQRGAGPDRAPQPGRVRLPGTRDRRGRPRMPGRGPQRAGTAGSTRRRRPRDLEAIRAALGEPRLSFMAGSYGGVPAAACLRLFPEHVRAMCLDGVSTRPPAGRTRTSWPTGAWSGCSAASPTGARRRPPARCTARTPGTGAASASASRRPRPGHPQTCHP